MLRGSVVEGAVDGLGVLEFVNMLEVAVMLALVVVMLIVDAKELIEGVLEVLFVR